MWMNCLEKILEILREMNDFVNCHKLKMIKKMPEFKKNSLYYGLDISLFYGLDISLFYILKFSL